MEILDYVTIENLIPKDVCETVLEKIKQREEWKPHEWYNNISDSRHSEETKELDILPTETNTQEMMTPFILQSIEMYMAHIKSSKTLIKTFTPIRFNRYAEGQVMRRSLVGLLNDDYEGAKMIVCDTEFPMKRGDIIIMPSVFLYPHEITECTKGTRYSWVSWAF